MKKLGLKMIIASIMLIGSSLFTFSFATTPVECFEAGNRSSNFSILAYNDTYLEGEIVKDCPKDVVIPDTISGKQVKYIKQVSFQNKDLTSVILPEGLEEIGYSAFQGNKLTSITIPSSVKTIGSKAFYAQVGQSLESVTFHEGLETIDFQAFGNNSITAITIPSTVTIIKNQAFRDNQIATLDFAAESQLKTIEYNAFDNNKISTLVIPDSVETIGATAFNKNSLTSVTIGSSVTSIGSDAFLNNSNISSLTIKGNSLKSIGSRAFFTNKLESLVLPDSLESIGYQAFSNGKLKNLTLGSELKTIDYDAFNNNQLSEVSFKEKLESIGNRAFAYNKPDGTTIQTVQGYINKEPSTVTLGTDAGIVLSRSPHNLTFDTNGGSAIASQIYGKDALIIKPEDPTKDGYLFAGWYKEADFTTLRDFATDTMPNNDLILYAKWTPTSYTITYNLDGGSNGSNPVNYTIETADITLQEATKVGHTFAGWYDAATEGNKVVTITLGSFGDKTLYARWTVNQYPVTFNSNGGSDVDSQMVDYETKIAEPTVPTKAGYTFLGWYKEVELTNQWNFSTDTMPLDGTTLYAKWVQSSYTVTFKNGYDETTLKTETVAYGADATAPADPTRAGHTFQGWDLAFTNVTSDLTITATWKINTYTVTFNSNGGNTISDQNITHGSPIENVVPTKEGNGFAGWFTDAGFSTEWVSTNPVVGNMTLYAKWNIDEYTVIFKNGYDGGILQSSSVAYGSNAIAPSDPVREGYTFKGWDIDFNNVVSNLTINATWEINTYTVTFDTNGGSAVDIQNIAYQAKIQKPMDPTKDSYVFKGWYKETAFTTLWDFDTDTIPSNAITLYAKWADAVKISFDTKGGAAIDDLWLEKNTVLIKPIDPNRAGYNFQGWFANTELTIAWDFATTIDADTTLYAKWTVKTSSGGGGGGGSISIQSDSKEDEDKITEKDEEDSEKITIEEYTNKLLQELTADFLKNNNETILKKLKKIMDSINQSDYSNELKNTYLYAYLRGITTMDSIEKAKLEHGITRAEMAKMMVVFAQKVLAREIVTDHVAVYKDVVNMNGDLPEYIQLAYQLQIMGIDANGDPIPKFNPYGLVTRAEFATVLSRVLFGNQYNSKEGSDYYSSHISALKNAEILTNTDPKIRELRGWVMLMLMRAESIK